MQTIKTLPSSIPVRVVVRFASMQGYEITVDGDKGAYVLTQKCEPVRVELPIFDDLPKGSPGFGPPRFKCIEGGLSRL